jgi:hypothetical protein
MDRLCTECNEKIEENSVYSHLNLQKLDHTGDLCSKCWDIEWDKCKNKVKEVK